MRWFYSKGAFLVLVWVLLSTMAIALTIRAAQELTTNNYYPDKLAAIPLPLGWLAHTKFGSNIDVSFMLEISVFTLFLDYEIM